MCFTLRLSATESKYTTATWVLVSFPISNVETTKSSDFTLRLINPKLNFKLSLNPSRGPLITILVGGSETALTVISSMSHPKITVALSTKIKQFPSRSLSIALSKDENSVTSLLDKTWFFRVVNMSSSGL